MRRLLLSTAAAACLAIGCADPNPPRTTPPNNGGSIKVDAPGVKVDVQTKGNSP